MTTDGGTIASALAVPVPEAEPVVGPYRRLYDPAAAAGIPAHISLVVPWAPPDAIDDAMLAELRALFGAVRAFDYRLVDTGRFPGVLWLRPEPGEPFIRLTAAVLTRWPEYPPYEGRHDEIVPHLTVAHGDDALLDRIEEELRPRLPIDARATEVWLMLSDGARWGRAAVFPFRSADNLAA